MDDYDSTFKHYLDLVENKLIQVIKDREPKNLYFPIEYILLDGGKRIRPLLCMLGCQSTGGDPYEAVDAAVAIEIMHNFTLVHDDIMDNSSVRRGKTTIHLKWDLPTAILSGDAMVGLALEVLSNYSNYANFGKIIEQFVYGYLEVCEGQALDMLFNKKVDVTSDDYFTMIQKKTAAVIQTSLAIGGLCSGAVEEDIETLREFGLNLGIAFQLQDDLLDLTASKDKLGKPIGNDILEKKKTLIVILAKERAKNAKDKELIDLIFSETPIASETISDYVNLFEKLDVFSDIQEIIDSYFDKARNSIFALSKNEGTKMLKYLLDKINVRSY
ncbi:MAG: polyprenyl synthetase family protein [Ignavibacteria bacterium]|nr:polyprenyl synthetase family protein [Ignavibacteria bacterium]